MPRVEEKSLINSHLMGLLGFGLLGVFVKFCYKANLMVLGFLWVFSH